MVYLMRHGQDDETYIGGWSNVSLISEGVEEVKECANWIKDNLYIKKIICSDVRRAVETAEIVSEILGVEFTKSEKLREQNKGILNGALRKEADLICPGYKERGVDFVFPKGESLEMLYERVKKFLDEFDIEDNTLLITHRGFINAIYYITNNIPLDMKKKRFDVVPGSIHEYDNEMKRIKRIK